MSRVPKWLGDTIENIFTSMTHAVTVAETTYVDGQFKRVRFEGDLSRARFAPGQVVKLRVTETEYRHYTPSFFDTETGVCEMLFYLHGGGPGSEWARKLEPGHTVKLLGPGGQIRYNDAAKYHFFFGDETSIGLFRCMKEKADAAGHEYLCLLELDETCADWPDKAGLSAEAVCKSKGPGVGAAEILETLSTEESVFWQVWDKATFYLTGRARSIQVLRAALRKRGIKSSQIQTEAYWEMGKKGL